MDRTPWERPPSTRRLSVPLASDRPSLVRHWSITRPLLVHYSSAIRPLFVHYSSTIRPLPLRGLEAGAIDQDDATSESSSHPPERLARIARTHARRSAPGRN